MKLSMFSLVAILVVGLQGAPIYAKQVPKHKKSMPVDNGFIVEKAALVFVHATDENMQKAIGELKGKYDEESTSEIASDVGYYEMKITDFAAKQKVQVLDTKLTKIIFKKADGKTVEFKNENKSISSHIYMFDGKKDPKLIQDVATFDDGKEFTSYFGQGKKN